MSYNDKKDPVEFFHFTIKPGDYSDEVMGQGITYTVKDSILNVMHGKTPLLTNRRCHAGERFDVRIDGDDVRIVGENCVPAMLPQTTISKPVEYRSTFYNAISESVETLDMDVEIVNESVEDKIYNFETGVTISRAIRKQLIKVCKLEEKLAKASYVNKEVPAAKNNTAEITRELVFERKKLNSMKKLLTSEEKTEFNKLEKFANKEMKEIISKNKKEAKSDNSDKDKKEDKKVEESTTIEYSTDIIEISSLTGLSLEESQALWDETIKEDQEYIEGVISKTMNDVTKKQISELTKDINRANLMKKHFSDKYHETGNENDKKKSDGYRMQAKRLGQKRTELLGKVQDHRENVLDRAKGRVIKADQKRRDVEAIANMFATEAADMEEEIKPIVQKLNEKGYKVKYASPGHLDLRKKEDREPDGVYYGKLYSDARVMFDDDYGLSKRGHGTPKHWRWREVDGCDYLDAVDLPYDEKDGTPNEVFKKFKDEAMASLKEYVDKLPKRGESDVKEESLEIIDFTESVEEIISEIE